MSPGFRGTQFFFAGIACVAVGVTPGAVFGQQAGDYGLIEYVSDASFDDTVERIEAAVTERGLFLMRVVDHAAAAAQVGRELGPNTVVLFGNPRVGSQIMACAPSAGIDLPQKLHVWEDGEAVVHVAYNNPEWLAERHSIGGCDEILGRVKVTLAAIARDVAGIVETDG
jgi:uncharacterized protein (DUF302 family)